MPKQVDNYVLERKIGAGQFGEVFKGYNKVNGQDVAVKVVRRDLLKGKFLELLENEISVLKSCSNNNIIKLYDMKKTANNFYLILEYCNESDLGVYLKQKKYLTEDEGVEYLLQIFNAFKTLTKDNIMHRDFKLANILKHNGTIKVADFGFAKLLGEEGTAATMLGSPLNMAPEVLDGAVYNNKADIWSVGTVFYELLFGRPPFMATNIVELKRNVKTKKLEFPRKINNISAECEDVIKKMLTVDPNKRITWEELFVHKINFYREDNIKKDLEKSLAQDDNLLMNMSKFYINNNKVVQHVADINKKQELNDFTRDVAKGKKKESYKGPIFNKKTLQLEEEEKANVSNNKASSPKGNDQDSGDLSDLTNQETSSEALTKNIKRSSNRILHERNKYAFLASVAEEAVSKNLKNSLNVGLVLTKKLALMIHQLLKDLKNNVNIFKLDAWDIYVKSKEYKAIIDYLVGECDMFDAYYKGMFDKATSYKNPNAGKVKTNFFPIMEKGSEEEVTVVYNETLKEFLDEIFESLKKAKDAEEARALWLHADQIADCLTLDENFKFEDSNQKQFNFGRYYDEVKLLELDKLSARVKSKVKTA